MIETKGRDIEGVLQTAQKQLNKTTPTLVSITEHISKVDLLSFFAMGKELGMNRTFWSDSSQQQFLVGIGETYTLQAKEHTYEMIQTEWQQLMEHAIVNKSIEVSSIGPVAIGGFPFDEGAHHSDLWQGYEGSKFRIPKYLLTVHGAEYYLSINLLLTQNCNISTLAEAILKEKEQLLSNKVQLDITNKVILQHEVDPIEWKDLVKQVTNHIEKTSVEKIVLARELQVEFAKCCNITEVLQRLLDTQQNSYVFAWEKDDACFVGATPERLVKVTNEQLLSTCLAGTASRGRTKKEDAAIGQALLHDPKNIKEHQIVVDMIYDAVSSCAHDVVVPTEPVLYPLHHLQHLYTPVVATLNKGFTLLDIVKKLHPTPALSGFPQQESIQFLREHESLQRGWYGAPIGWFDAHFNGEFAVAIRSALVRQSHASLFAGCGVVRDSDPEMEYEETKMKFTPMLDALGGEV
ncbi:isochorismate synthase MenF [Gracilibacillus marinus]|uniref:Isochorismate synthase MenF n=1 Tax=Gracilibacillus marinus TaxID=630535 RepID=A0ABV8VRW2_9BACI